MEINGERIHPKSTSIFLAAFGARRDAPNVLGGFIEGVFIKTDAGRNDLAGFFRYLVRLTIPTEAP